MKKFQLAFYILAVNGLEPNERNAGWKWKKNGPSYFNASFVAVKIHVTYIIAIDSGGENSSSDTVNSYDHNCIGRYMLFYF